MTEKVQLPKSQVPTLGRPTRPDDPAPVLNFDEYFNGKWTFTWDVPEGKPTMAFAEFARGARLAGIEHLGRSE